MVEISVIIPVYNAGKYLEECIESILNQTYSNYEIIFVNDGSTDNSLEILNQYKEKYPEKIYVYSQTNQGQSSARNYAVSKAKGTYIAYIDADDKLEKDYFETLYNTAVQNKSEMVICSYEKFDNNGTILIRRNAKDWEIDFGNGLTHTFQYSPCAKLISRKMLVEKEISFMEGEKMEDGPYGIMTNSIAKNIVVLDYMGYKYRVYDESTMGGIRNKGISIARNEQKFPLKGIEYATKKVKEIKGSSYDDVLEFCVLKAIAGFVFVFCKRNDKETHKAVCDFANYMINTYFTNAKKNPYIKKRIKKLPFSHWMAVKLLVITNEWKLLYPFARFYKFLFRK
jgi:glycosyltransferase involved in cell wall biosynthesis